MMKKLQLSQNTPEWLEYRRLKIGASDCSILLSGSPREKEALWKEKNEGISRYSTPAMLNGSKNEPIALKIFNEEHGTCYEAACFESIDYPWMIASYDGFDPISETHIEIKCPYTDTNFNKLAYGDIPEKYIWQLHHQMMVSGSPSTTLVVFNSITQEIVMRDVIRDFKKTDLLLKVEESYYLKSIMGFETPDFKTKLA